MRRAFALVVLCLAPLTPARAADPVRIAVLDTGIEATHPEFRPDQVVGWRDFLEGEPEPFDDHGHGTAVASRAAGRWLGVHHDAELLIGRVLDGNNRLRSWTDLAAAIRWAADNDADVINVSIWGSVPQPTESYRVGHAINHATRAGALVVWIAGNGSVSGVGIPSTVLAGSSSPQALVVGASSVHGTPAPFSQLDPELLAHGWDVPIASLNGTYTMGSGTSFAAPWVAGAAARLIANGAPRDPSWLEWVLLHAARDQPVLTYPVEGYGFLGKEQLQDALAIARGEQPVQPLDERDVFHAATTVPRVAQTTQVPSGTLPPG